MVGRVKGEKQLWREEIEISQVGGEERRMCEGKWSVVETEQLEEGKGECVVQDRGRGVIIIHIQHSLSGSECSPLVWRRSLTSGLTCRRRVASGHVNEHLDFSERERCFVSGFFGE